MSFLEGLFGKNGRVGSDRTETFDNDNFNYTTTERAEEKTSPMEVFHPASYDDVGRIIDALRAGKNTIVHLENLKPATALRVIDMLSGAVYALKGGLYEIQKNTYMFSPSGVSIK